MGDDADPAAVLAKAKEHAALVVRKPPKDEDPPYDADSLAALKMTLVVGAYFTVWVRYLSSKAGKTEPWMLWIGRVTDQAVPGSLIQKEKYPWATYVVGAEGKGWKVPPDKTPFPIDGVLTPLKMEYAGFSFAVDKKDSSPPPSRPEEPKFPTWEEVSQMDDDEISPEGQSFHVLSPDRDRFDPKYRVDNKTNAFDPDKWQLWLHRDIEYSEWKIFVRGYFAGVGRDGADRKLVQEKVQQLFLASQLYWSTQGTVMHVHHWKESVKKLIVFLLARKKGQNGMDRTMVDEITNAFEDLQDPPFFQAAETKGRENFKVNRMAPSVNAVYPYRNAPQTPASKQPVPANHNEGRGGGNGRGGGRSRGRGGRGRGQRQQEPPAVPAPVDAQPEQSN